MVITADEDLYGKGRQRSCDPYDEIVQQMAFVDREAPIGTYGEASAPHRGHKRFYELLREMERIHDEKNHDYADSASDPLRNFRGSIDLDIEPYVNVLSRIGEKYMRACNVTRMSQQGRAPLTDNEPLTETLLDIANYCLIAIILYEEGGDAQ